VFRMTNQHPIQTDFLTDPLLDEVKAVLESTGLSRGVFGFRSAGDPTLVLKMERGRHIKKKSLRDKIKAELKRVVAEHENA